MPGAGDKTGNPVRFVIQPELASAIVPRQMDQVVGVHQHMEDAAVAGCTVYLYPGRDRPLGDVDVVADTVDIDVVIDAVEQLAAIDLTGA